MNIAVFWDGAPNSLADMTTLIMEAERYSESSVNIYQTTRRQFPEDSHINVISYLHNQKKITNFIFTIIRSHHI
jgi:hypothetical protein